MPYNSIGACLPRAFCPLTSTSTASLQHASYDPASPSAHPSFHATIAFGRFVQRTSSTLKSHDTAFASRSIDRSIFHATMHARERHLCAVVPLASSNRRSSIPVLKKRRRSTTVYMMLAVRVEISPRPALHQLFFPCRPCNVCICMHE